MIKKIIILTFLTIVSVQLFSIEPKLEGTVWELSYMDNEDPDAIIKTGDDFTQSLGDLNGDGVEEVISMQMFMTFNNSIVKIYTKMNYEGSVEYFELMGMSALFNFTETKYSISGNSIFIDEEKASFLIKDSKLTLKDVNGETMIFKINRDVNLSEATPMGEEDY